MALLMPRSRFRNSPPQPYLGDTVIVFTVIGVFVVGFMGLYFLGILLLYVMSIGQVFKIKKYKKLESKNKELRKNIKKLGMKYKELKELIM